MLVGPAPEQALRHDIVAGAADGGDAVGEEVRQNLVRRDARLVEHVGQMNVRVDEARDQELAFPIEDFGCG